MPQYRKLYIKVTYSLDFNEMPDDFTRLFWVLLPLGLSSEGTCLAHPGYIRSKIFPLRSDVTDAMICSALQWYADHDMIRFYQVAGRSYLWMVNFAKYQGRTEKEARSDFPPVPDAVKSKSGVSPELVESKSGTDAIFNMQYADADADAETTPNGVAGAYAPANPGPAADELPFSEEPEKPSEPTRRVDKPPTEHQVIFAALRDVCHVLQLTDKQRGWLNKHGKWLLDNGFSPGDVRNFGAWWESDAWRREHTPMTVPRFEANFGAWVQAGKPLRSSGNGKSGIPAYDDLAAWVKRQQEVSGGG